MPLPILILQKDLRRLTLVNYYKNITLPTSEIGGYIKNHIPMLEDVLEITNPKIIFEIGFNAGQSALLWLQHSQPTTKLLSVDPGEHYSVHIGSNIIKENFPNRFVFFHISSQTPWLKDWILGQKEVVGLTFVDGDHSYGGCLSDLVLAENIGTPYILVDNCEDIGAVNRAVEDFLIGHKYELLKTYTIHFYSDAEEKVLADTHLVKLLKRKE